MLREPTPQLGAVGQSAVSLLREPTPQSGSGGPSRSWSRVAREGALPLPAPICDSEGRLDTSRVSHQNTRPTERHDQHNNNNNNTTDDDP